MSRAWVGYTPPAYEVAREMPFHGRGASSGTPIWPLIVLHPGEQAVWIPGGHDLGLPVLRLSHDGGVWYGNAETIVQLARETWGLDVVLLRSPASLVDRETRTPSSPS